MIRDKDQEAIITRRSLEAILEILRSIEPRQAIDKIITLYYLLSKDIQLVMANKESRIKLETSYE